MISCDICHKRLMRKSAGPSTITGMVTMHGKRIALTVYAGRVYRNGTRMMGDFCSSCIEKAAKKAFGRK